jgi:hypothetical protein
VHKIEARTSVPKDTPAGWYLVGLWLPDASESLRMDPRYAIRAANRDVPWWRDGRGRYGINVIGRVEIVR